jgi:hypothetical protein
VTATPGSLAPVRFSESESSQPGLRAWPQAQAANRAQSLIPGGSVTVPDHRIQMQPIAFLHSGDDSAIRSKLVRARVLARQTVTLAWPTVPGQPLAPKSSSLPVTATHSLV